MTNWDLFKTLLTGIGIVLFWRGIWLAADVFIFPNDIYLSISVCVVVGLVIIYYTKYKNF